MPCGNAHLTINAISFIPAYNMLIEDKSGDNSNNKIIELLTAGVGVMSTAKLPDKIEPAIHPNHRDFYHSIAFAIIVGIIGFAAWKDLQQRRDQRGAKGIFDITPKELLDVFIIGGAVGYITHLVADGFTPKGLPLA